MRKKLHNIWNGLFEEINRPLWVIIFASVVLILNNSWVPGFFLDGGIYATLGRNAAELGHWLVPHYTKTHFPKFFEHPPLVFILEGFFFKLFKSSWTSARIFSWSWAFLIFVMLWKIFKDQREERKGFYAGLVTLLCLPFLKKARFPTIDLPLAFFLLGTCYYVWKSIRISTLKYWTISGIFFGLALLTKGFPAIIILPGIFIYLLINRNLKALFNFKPWYGLGLGCVIFLVWPLSLYSIGEIQGFQYWIDKQFLKTVVEGRGAAKNDYFMYLKIVFSFCLPWMTLFLFNIKYKIQKREFNNFIVFAALQFLFILFAFSLVKWKYAHYILPIFPFLGIVTADILDRIIGAKFDKTVGIFAVAILTAGMLLMSMPLTNKVRRDKVLHEITDHLDRKGVEAKNWVDVVGSYGFWSFSAALNFPKKRNTIPMGLEELTFFLAKPENLLNSVLYINEMVYTKLDEEKKRLILESAVKYKEDDSRSSYIFIGKGIFQQ